MAPCPSDRFAADATLADVGRVRPDPGARRERSPKATHVLIGPGDDAAVLRRPRRACRRLHRPDGRGPALPSRLGRRPDVGHRAAAQNLSDINAMGGTRAPADGRARPRPPTCRSQWVLDLADGIAEECRARRRQRRRRRPHPRRPGRDRGDRDGRRATAAPVLRSGAQPGRRAGARRPAGLGGRRAGRARSGVPLAAGARRGLPAPGAAVRRRRRRPPRPGRPR